jgi:hypothetical protein
MALAERSMLQASDAESNANIGQDNSSKFVASATRTLTLCEPCIARCHTHHKGVKFLFTAISSRTLQCMCDEISKYTRSTCSACVVSEEQMRTQRFADQFKQELRRQRQLNFDYPPIFACIPRQSRANRSKTLAGWHLCRICKPTIKDKFGEEMEVPNEFDMSSMNDQESDDDNSTVLSEDSELTSEDENIKTDKVMVGLQISKQFSSVEPAADKIVDNSSLISKNKRPLARGSAEEKSVSIQVPFENTLNITGDDNSVITCEATIAESLDKLLLGKEAYRHKNLSKKRVKHPNHAFLQSKTMESIVSLVPADGWVEVLDIEEPEELKFDDLVVCERQGGLLKLLARVKSKVQHGFYKVRYDDHQFGEEVLNRSKLEVLSRQKFWFNVFTGQSAWARDDVDRYIRQQNSVVAVQAPVGEGEVYGNDLLTSDRKMESNENDDLVKVFDSQPLLLNGLDWHELYDRSIMRRGFDTFDEMIHEQTGLIFYVRHELLQKEIACLLLQRLFRQKHWRSGSNLPFVSKCFQFDLPEVVETQKRDLCGWAYLRRRSKNVGDFLDIDGMEWEEYMDNTTSEFFYWQEDENMYRWEKPALFQKKSYTSNQQFVFKCGDDCLFLFPGHRKEEVAVITRVRFDDETNEPLYDVQVIVLSLPNVFFNLVITFFQ